MRLIRLPRKATPSTHAQLHSGQRVISSLPDLRTLPILVQRLSSSCLTLLSSTTTSIQPAIQLIQMKHTGTAAATRVSSPDQISDIVFVPRKVTFRVHRPTHLLICALRSH